MAAAETGSGKTGAFVLPILQVVHESVALPSQPLGASAAEPCRLNLDDRDAVMALTPDGIFLYHFQHFLSTYLLSVFT